MGKFWKAIGKGLAKGVKWAMKHPEVLDVVVGIVQAKQQAQDKQPEDSAAPK